MVYPKSGSTYIYISLISNYFGLENFEKAAYKRYMTTGILGIRYQAPFSTLIPLSETAQVAIVENIETPVIRGSLWVSGIRQISGACSCPDYPDD
jgi:hypothetical protein